MKARLSAAVATLVALVASTAVAAAVAPLPAQAQGGGFQTSGTQLLDANGNPFIARGTSVPHVWFQQNSPAQFDDVADLGANAVRVVLGSAQHGGGPWGPSLDVGNVIDWCKQNEMVCMLEIHDATGFGEDQNAVSIMDVVDGYWANQTVMDAVQGEEDFVLVNIANEPRGNNDAGVWVQETEDAIEAMRDLGYDHTLVVDAPNWGQDWQFNMRDNAETVAGADPQDNTMFSIHMYEVFSSPGNVTAYLDAFADLGLPLMVGEFGHNHNGQDVAWETVMSEAQARGIGWFGWSWSGNSGGAENLDQSVNFNPDNLTQWGQDLFNGPNGIAQTAQTATVFDGGNGGDDPPPTPTGLTVTDETDTTVSLSWNASAGATSYLVERAQGGGFSQVGTTSTTSLTDTGLTPETTYQYRVTAANSAGASDPSDPVPAMTEEDDNGNGGGGDCAVDYSASDWGGHPGFTANVAITNTGSSTIDGWDLVWDFPAGQVVNDFWSSSITQGGSVTATNVGWNATINPGQSVSFGFNGEATAPGNNPAPTAFTLNGTSCDVS